MRMRIAAVAAGAGLIVSSCGVDSTRPLAPVTGPDPSGSSSRGSTAGAYNEPPDAVFRTSPAADAGGFIGGRAPLDVTFNMCPTTDVDPGDELKYRYDFEGQDRFQRGRCRETYTYGAGCRKPTICTSDRQPDHERCRTYLVCADAPGPSLPTEFLTCTLGATGVIPPGETRVFTFTGSSGLTTLAFSSSAPLTITGIRTAPPPPMLVGIGNPVVDINVWSIGGLPAVYEVTVIDGGSGASYTWVRCATP